MFKLKKKLHNSLEKFLGVSFTYGQDVYKISSIGEGRNGEKDLAFFLNDTTTMYIEISRFNKDIDEGNIKLITNVSV